MDQKTFGNEVADRISVRLGFFRVFFFFFSVLCCFYFPIPRARSPFSVPFIVTSHH